MTEARIQATRTGCCDAAGRMLMLAQQPVPRSRLVFLALARGEGTREEIEGRITDMLAGGLLIELHNGEGATWPRT